MKLQEHLKTLEADTAFRNYEISVREQIEGTVSVIVEEKGYNKGVYTPTPITDQVTYTAKGGNKIVIDIRIEQYSSVKLSSLIALNTKLNSSLFTYLSQHGAEL